ncbi:hypothetical protein C8R48DRAFT_680462 [Suillus tomentosus]|nr:hypothetical protein C8R48DRAFT_680462 [Suillus tomentosus]
MANFGSYEDTQTGFEHESYVYDPQFSALSILCGSPTFSIDFVGYLSIGPRPTLHPLYLKDHLVLVAYVAMPVAHFSAFEMFVGTDVPVFVLANRDGVVPPLNLPWVRNKTGIDTMLYGVYNHDGVAHEHEAQTIIHYAGFPMGYYAPTPDVDYSVSFQTSDNVSQSDALWQSHSVQDSSIPISWLGYTVNTVSVGSSSVLDTTPEEAVQPEKKVEPAQMNLYMIMKECPKWKKALAHLRLGYRLEVCLGQTENPHLLVTSVYAGRRSQLIRTLWPQCLVRANVTAEQLETVLNTVTKVPLSHDEVLLMTGPWLSLFLYDIRRVVIRSIDDVRGGFGLGSDTIWGIALRDKLLGLVQMFIRPYANVLPIAINGFAIFLAEQITKEIAYHIVFRINRTCKFRLVLADLDPAAFRHAPHPPLDTLALVGSSCYEVLLARLISIWGVTDIMPNFPTVIQVHQELRETVFMLLLQENDPGYVLFLNVLRSLCTITLKMDNSAPMASHEAHRSFPMDYRPPRAHFLGNDQSEAALVSWLQKRGHDTLPESLFVTASVLFAWVDSHDLMAFLDDRMLRAQMEVSLFSNAIANACEELETRSHSDEHTINPKKPAAVKAVENVRVCSAPSLVRLGCFQPPSEIIDKCNAWLLSSSYTTKVNVSWKSTFPQPLEPEYLPISKDIFLLPAFLKAWVNQITYCTYMTASLAEAKPPRLNTRHSFKAKESKSLDMVRSDIHILDLKKHRAQTEVDMLSEAISRIAESDGTTDSSDGSSASVVTDGHDDDCSDDWFSSSCASSNVSVYVICAAFPPLPSITNHSYDSFGVVSIMK